MDADEEGNLGSYLPCEPGIHLSLKLLQSQWLH